MDRAELSEHSIHEVGALFETALRDAAAELGTADLDGIERRLQVETGPAPGVRGSELLRGRRGGRGLLVARLRRGVPARAGHVGGAHSRPAGRRRGVDLAPGHALPRRRRHRGGREARPLSHR